MKITFYGAAQEVTGSKHLLEINGYKILLDCGLFQGHRFETIAKNEAFLPIPATEIDALVLSHSHIDHSGAIPLLFRKGFRGPIYATSATIDLCRVMLGDSAHIQERDAEWLQKKKKQSDAQPLYTAEEAEKCLELFVAKPYGEAFEVAPGAKVTFSEAGHILGSAMETWELEDLTTHRRLRLGFTGDLGRKSLPILRDPQPLKDLDVLITESTYGNRHHDEISQVEDHLITVINETYEKSGKIIIPAFAVERTQEVLYLLCKLQNDKKIPTFPIYVDSPLATSATEIFAKHPEYFDDHLQKLLNEGGDPFSSEGAVQFVTSVEDSKQLNRSEGPMIVISASGMAEFGRIRHHLSNAIEDERNMVLIIGFMAANTLGRKLVERESPINIFGEPHQLRARVEIFNAFSGHADQTGLLNHVAGAGDLKKVFLVHGESDSQKIFANLISELPNAKQAEVLIPEGGQSFEL